MAKKDNAQNWMIGTGGSDHDGVEIERVHGTKAQVKKYLVSLVRDSKGDPEDTGYDYGTDKMNEIEEKDSGSLYAYAVFSDYHIDFEAHPEKEAKDLTALLKK